MLGTALVYKPDYIKLHSSDVLLSLLLGTDECWQWKPFTNLTNLEVQFRNTYGYEFSLPDVCSKAQKSQLHALGDSKYAPVPQDIVGFLDPDTLHALASKKFVKFGGPQDADQPESRLPSTLDIWKPIIEEDLA
ncbi:hypothetical protein OIU74_021055 [Salix koriyanagi]|uniref:Uncharacterized protein n=1 Tax=Salix koriyanagi TaxID=2511006 RepID=A0A9Q0SMK9_9ROSI|nr:hypothetical protein OIU74_021055 [Salix koriyanagi]